MFLQIDETAYNVKYITRVNFIAKDKIQVIFGLGKEEHPLILYSDRAARFFHWWQEKAEVYVA